MLRRLATLVIVVIGWVIFRAENLSQAIEFTGAMFGFSDLPISYELIRALNYRNAFFMMTALSVFFLPGNFSLIKLLMNKNDPIPVLAGAVLILLLLPYCAALIVGGASGPFIYYRF